ncbi:sterol desaturase family protein [Candidatus Cyanaurora vandensis]|uniref:sterol desaturase family protein n=1 Tax=Candidatus Cyanaurora vandensis TaxID=2714958 RepID=UPI00257E2EE1|nr:sterol desaturase family protein [Candidatus Cyanaurora vandensis]
MGTCGLALLLLVLGDFFSTFLYHVPEHVFGKYHMKVHHSPNRSFIHYAVLSSNARVLVDGLLGAAPYILVAGLIGVYDLTAALIGILLGQVHVWWRHTSILKWETPRPLQTLCSYCWIVTPEIHWLHHQNINLAYGDIFTFYDKPAQMWLSYLRKVYFKRLA